MTTKITKEQKQVIERLKFCAETDLNAAIRALSSEATEKDIKTACFLAHLYGIEYDKNLE